MNVFSYKDQLKLHFLDKHIITTPGESNICMTPIKRRKRGELPPLFEPLY